MWRPMTTTQQLAPSNWEYAAATRMALLPVTMLIPFDGGDRGGDCDPGKRIGRAGIDVAAAGREGFGTT